jgi:ligand-binding sensor domain-containing protein
MRTIFLNLVLLLLTPAVFSQPFSGWSNILSRHSIRSITETQTDLWFGTEYGGLLRINKSDSSKTGFDIGNSGLPSNRISLISADNSANIWCGTDRGLALFDGLTWARFDTSNSPLPDLYITALATDGDALWTGTQKGLVHFENGSWTVYDSANSTLGYNEVRALFPGSGQTLWVVAGKPPRPPMGPGDPGDPGNQTLFRFDGSQFIAFPFPLNTAAVTAIDEDPGESLWFSTSLLYSSGAGNTGVLQFDGATFTSFPATASFQDIRDLAIDSANGQLYLATEQGLVAFDGISQTDLFTQSGSGLVDDRVTALLKSPAGPLWIGTGNGISSKEGNNWTADSALGIASPWVNDILMCTASNWLGTANGLLKYDDPWSPSHWNNKNAAIPNNIIRRLATASNGDLLLTSDHSAGHEGRLFQFDGMDFSLLKTNGGLGGSTDQVNLSVATDGDIWCSLDVSGLDHFDGSVWTTYTTANSALPHNTIVGIQGLPDSTVWVGTDWWGGVIRIKDGNWTVYTTSNSDIPQNRAYSFALAPNGDTWIGFPGTKVARFDGQEFTLFTLAEPSFYGSTQDLLIEPSGQVWLTLERVGLFRFDGVDWFRYDMENAALPSLKLTRLEMDSLGSMWVGTQEGIAVAELSQIGPGSLVNVVPTTIDPQSVQLPVKAYPNPASEWIWLETPGLLGARWQLLDMAGRELAGGEIWAEKHRISLSGVAAGIYIFRVNDGQRTGSVKLVKQ